MIVAFFPTACRAVMALGIIASPALCLTLEFPAPVLRSAQETAALSSYALPIGPFAAGAMQTRPAEGALEQRAVRLDAPGATTLQLLAPLRAQLVGSGYRILYECAAFECGGFDFRYGTEVLPEPDMHVDLGDYRFLAAEAADGSGVVSLLVSRSSQAGFVQMMRVTKGPLPPLLSASSKSPDAAPTDATPTDATPSPPADGIANRLPNQLADQLAAGAAVVLEDLEFPSGQGVLVSAKTPQLAELAALMRDRPDTRITMIGHTDASGPLQANVTLSQARAAAVRQALVDMGIAADRINVQGLGPQTPRADNDTAEGRRKNRRVEVIMTPTQVTP